MCSPRRVKHRKFAVRDRGVAIGDDALQQSAGILHAGQVGRFCGHRGERLGLQFHAAMERKIVGQNGHPHRAADVHQMVGELLLGRPDIVRGDDRDCVHADALRLLRERDRVARADAAYVRDHRHASRDGLLAEAKRHGPLFQVHRAEFTRRPVDEQSVDPRRDQRVDQQLPRRTVNPFVVAQRCYQRGNHSVKRSARHASIVPVGRTLGRTSRG